MTRCEIVTVGTELLLGETVDTNAADVARAMRAIGIDVDRITTVGDDLGRIQRALVEAAGRCDCIVVTGGLGPTVDDATREALAAACGARLAFQPALWAGVEAMVRRFGREPTTNDRRQATVPLGAQPIDNPVGTAPGLVVELGRAVVFALPGVPREMRHLLEAAVVPRLRARHGPTDVIALRVLHTTGAGESRIDELVGDLESLPNPTVGLSAAAGQVDIRITAKAASEAEAQALLDGVAAEIRSRLGVLVFGADDDTLASVVMDLLAARGWCLTAIESGLGGALVHLLAHAPGPLRRAELVAHLAPAGLRPAVDAYRHLHGADVGVGVRLDQRSGQSLAEVALVWPGGADAARAAFGGHPDLGPDRAAMLALDLMRRRLGEGHAGP